MSVIADYIARPWTLNLPVQIPGVGRDDLAAYFAERRFMTGVEVGTERGYYAETLCKSNPNLHLTCVDPYLAYEGYREHTSQDKLNSFYAEAQLRLQPYSVTFIRDFSKQASLKFENNSIDFVFIDGNHSLFHVIQDLHYWVPKVRKGGIVSGHDWIRRKRTNYLMHVEQAVTAYCDAYDIRPLFVLGRKAVINGEVRDKPRSWFFIK